MSDVFVSYKQEDRARAARVVHALEAEGLTVWWDQHIEPGAHWRESITQALATAKCVIVLWTEISVQSQGRFVHDEASHADRRGVYLPARLDQVDLPLGFGQQQCISLVGWRGDRNAPQFQTLLAAARAMIAGEGRPRAAHHARRRGAIDRRWLIGGGVAVLGVAGLATVFLAPDDMRRGIGLSAGPPEPSTIAVLAFRNLSGDVKQDYLCEGLSEELRDALSRLNTIRVAARTSSEAFRDARTDTATIAGKLGVAFILDGSVRTSGQMLRVSAQLIDAKSGLEKWSQSFDRALTDVISVQTGIAASVAESLRGALSGADAALVARPATTVPVAFDALLQGRQMYLQHGDEANNREALRFFDAAIAADPAYADAHAYRALTLMVLADNFGAADAARSMHEQAVASGLQAAQLAPASAYVQSVLGFTILFGQLDFAGARGPYERSIEMGPNDARVVAGYGQFASAAGQRARSLTMLARAVALDPLNPVIYLTQATALYVARHYAESIDAANRALSLSPAMGAAHGVIGDARFQLGDLTGSLNAYRAEPTALFRLTGMAIVLRRSGDVPGAQSALHELIAKLGDGAVYQQAQIHAQWGETDAALASLEKAFHVGDEGLEMVLVDPLLDPVRGDARFSRVIRGLNLT